MDAALAPTTKKSYMGIFKRFLQFAESKNVFSVEEFSLPLVLNFLELSKGIKTWSTMRTMAAALKFFLIQCNRGELFAMPQYLFFLKGCRRAAPIRQNRMCTWDPLGPLKALEVAPLPDVRPDLDRVHQFMRCAQEAIFLFLMALALRVDDVFKLGCEIVIEEHKWIRLFFLEKRKCPVNGRYTPFVELPFFDTCTRICPARALLRYLGIASEFRIENDPYLFISSKGRRAAKATLRRWIVDLLADHGVVASAGTCRSSASSLAFISGVPVHEILAAAGWSRESTFRQFYCRPVTSQSSVLFAHALREK